MNYRTAVGVTVAAMLALASASTVADQGKGRGGPDDRDQQMDSGQNDKRDIYGSELMAEEELDQYRKRLADMETEQERAKFQAQHRKMIDARAEALELEVEEAE